MGQVMGEQAREGGGGGTPSAMGLRPKGGFRRKTAHHSGMWRRQSDPSAPGTSPLLDEGRANGAGEDEKRSVAPSELGT